MIDEVITAGPGVTKIWVRAFNKSATSTSITIIGTSTIIDELTQNVASNTNFLSDFGAINWYPDTTDIQGTEGATDHTWQSISSEGHTFTINGTNTKNSADVIMRTLISNSIVRVRTYSGLNTESVNHLFPLIKGHQYRLRFDYISGTASDDECSVILRDKNHADMCNVSAQMPQKDIVWTSNDNEGYMFIYITTPGEVFTDYTFKVTLTDMTESPFGFTEDNTYRVTSGFARDTISTQDDAGSAQGICTDGTYIYTVATTDNHTNAHVMKIDTSGNLVGENVAVGNIEHANQLAYDPYNDLILAVGSDTNAYVYRIDPNTLELVDHLELTNVRNAMTEKDRWSGFWAIAYDADKDVFIIGSTRCYCVTNSDFSIIYKVVRQNYHNGDGQGLYPFGDVVYGAFVNGDYKFVAYNWDGCVIKRFNTPFPYKEFEGVCMIDGELYAHWNPWNNKSVVTKDTVTAYDYIQVTKVIKGFKF